VTEEDTQGLRWTGEVGKVVAGRVTSLARATLGAITSMAANGEINVVVSLASFRTFSFRRLVDKSR
jgi:hypothetical protein